MLLFNTALIVLITMTVSACDNTKFRGKSSDNKSDDANPIPPTDPAAKGELALSKPEFKNSKIAAPGMPGQVEVTFILKNCEANDEDFTGSFTVYSADFSNPSYTTEKVASTENPGQFDQIFKVSFDYKWVPEVTRYTKQQFALTMNRADGTTWSETVTYSITSSNPAVDGSAPKATKELSGTEGHPESK
jgi:hypothetical protein